MYPYRTSLVAMVPPGWHTKESVTLLSPDGMANVIASSEPIDDDMDSEDYARAQGVLLDSKEFSGFHESTFVQLEVFGGLPGYLRSFQWMPSDGDPVMQTQIYYADAGRGYTATATTTVRNGGLYEDQLLQLLRALVIDKAVSTVG